jgi:hypothetical protein
MLALYPWHREARARRKIDSNRKLATRSVEVDPGHVPRRRNPQRCLKQLVGHHEQLALFQSRYPTHSDFNRGFYDDPARRKAFVTASTLVTHTDPKALIGSLAVATVVALEVGQGNAEGLDTADLLSQLAVLGGEDHGQWQDLVRHMRTALQRGDDVARFAAVLGLEKAVSGYVYHTVPVAIYACLRHRGAFERALSAALDLGGDTDTVGAIVGAMAGASVGRRGIPRGWVSGILDWPRTPALLEKVGARLAQQQYEEQALGAVRYFWPAVLLRNLVFLVVVLFHGFRRLVPP